MRKTSILKGFPKHSDSDEEGQLTSLLQAWQAGDASAGEKLFAQVYPELRKIAAGYLRRRQDLTCQPTELVHEAYLKMEGGRQLTWKDRVQFFGFAAQIVRQVLIDHSRRKGAEKRSGEQVALDPDWLARPVTDPELLALDHALTRLADQNREAARIVELRYFGGLTIPEMADFLGIGTATVTRRWQMARAWLHRELTAT